MDLTTIQPLIKKANFNNKDKEMCLTFAKRPNRRYNGKIPGLSPLGNPIELILSSRALLNVDSGLAVLFPGYYESKEFQIR